MVHRKLQGNHQIKSIPEHKRCKKGISFILLLGICGDTSLEAPNFVHNFSRKYLFSLILYKDSVKINTFYNL